MNVLGISVTTSKQRICLIASENKEDEIRIIKNKSKLRKLTREMMYIDNDYTLKEQTKRSTRSRVVEERQRGIQVKVGYRKIVVDGREWKWIVKESDFETSQKVILISKN